MALKKPLAMYGGDVKQLQAGDTVDGAVSNPTFTATNANVGAITIGQPVYISAAGSVDEAQANAIGTAKVEGLVKDASIAAAASGSIQYGGVLDSADWTAVIGSANLTAGSAYFLDPTSPGQLTTTAPTTAGQFAVFVGRALSTTELLIEVARPIGL